ncbi:MAG: cytochrome c biogenesis protein CcdA [Planctomycetota bacterium]|jgi:thiol:disulfide interchange protein DsbD
MTTSPLLRLLLLSAFLVLSVESAAQDKLSACARFQPESAQAGQEVTLEVVLNIDEAYHLYGSLQDPANGTPTTLSILDEGGLEEIGVADIPPGEPHVMAGFETFWIAGEVILRQKFRVPAGLGESVKVEAMVDYMVCDDLTCDPPASLEVAANLAIAPGEYVDQDPKKAAEPKVDPDFLLPDLPLFGDDKKLSLQARFEPNPARPGEAVRLVLAVSMDPNWHIYGSLDPDPSKLVIEDSAGLELLGPLSLPEGVRHEVFETVNYWLEGEFEIGQFLAVPADSSPGELTIKGALQYLPCDPTSCLDPASEDFSLPLSIEAGPLRADYEPIDFDSSEAPTAGAADEIDESESGGLLGLILAAIGGGLFALLMPCTYPMIPITISFFTKQAADRGGKVLPLALVYGAGIVLMFVAIGVLVGPAIISFASHWVTNLVIGLLFFVFALVLFGLINLQPPKFLNQVSANAATRGGLVGVFLMGATLVVSSFTCSAPIIGTLLPLFSSGEGAFVSKYVDLGLGMAIFGATMAIPFVFLSLAPGKIQKMPRSGEWMNVLKVFLGFVEVAAALKFFSNAEIVWQMGILPRELFLLLWSGLFMIGGIYLLGLFRLKDDSPANIGPGRLTSALASILFAIYCLFGAQGYKMDTVMTAIVPPYSGEMINGVGGTKVSSQSGRVIIKDDYEAALAKARETGKKVFVNFTGFT